MIIDFRRLEELSRLNALGYRAHSIAQVTMYDRMGWQEYLLDTSDHFLDLFYQVLRVKIVETLLLHHGWAFSIVFLFNVFYRVITYISIILINEANTIIYIRGSHEGLFWIGRNSNKVYYIYYISLQLQQRVSMSGSCNLNF